MCDVCDFLQKQAILTLFEYNFACFWNHLKEKKRYSPNFKVVFGRFVVEDPEKKNVSSNVKVVLEQTLVA